MDIQVLTVIPMLVFLFLIFQRIYKTYKKSDPIGLKVKS